MSCVVLQQESCRVVSNKNVSSEQVWPFLGFPAFAVDASCADAARTALNTSTGPGLGVEPSAEGF